MDRFKIHYEDEYGPTTITTDTEEEFFAIRQTLYNDPDCENIWTEKWDPEHGWEEY